MEPPRNEHKNEHKENKHEKNEQYDKEFKEEYIETILFKVIIVGDSGVGKTSFFYRYLNKKFSTEYVSTMSIDFGIKEIRWNKRTNIRLQIWDTAGQERYGNFISMYFRDTKGAICMYSVDNKESKVQISKWKKLINEKVTLNGEEYLPPCIIIANKIDLDKNFDQTEVDARADQLEFAKGFCVSAKDDLGIDKAMKWLVFEMMNRRREEMKKGTYVGYDHKDIIDLNGDYDEQNSSCGC